MAYEQFLADAGFLADPHHPQYALVKALSHNGPYVIHGAWSKGDVLVHVEQNSAVNRDGLLITYPAVLVIQGPNGKKIHGRGSSSSQAACPADRDASVEAALATYAG